MRTRIVNIGTLVTGELAKPLSPAPSVTVEDGRIVSVDDTRPAGATDTTIDARGTTLAPGLWDSHHHPYFGEFTPRGEAFGTMTKAVRAGTVAVVSAGAAHQPGMYLPTPALPNVQAAGGAGAAPVARDAVGTKALAIVSVAVWRTLRPLGLKCFAETVIAETGLREEDFAELAEAGVRRLKFLRPIPSRAEAQRYTTWARDHGMLVMTHTGGRSLIGDCATIDEALRIIAPDIACHVNGGPTPPPAEVIDRLVDDTACTLDLVFHGNLRVAARILAKVQERSALGRVVIGSDSPSEGGVNPGAILRFVTLLAGVSGIAPEILYAMASGNTARAFGLPGGRIAVGEPADLVLWDPMEGGVTTDALECVAYGDRLTPGIVMIDGEIRVHADPRSIAPKRIPVVTVRS
ncbi:MAG TPA: amidohydrolase family protein [Candidatus Limnocylindria bacterium]|nr:amidohydrolase family protein [Candidatus Limnocylindria bacterium]